MFNSTQNNNFSSKYFLLFNSKYLIQFKIFYVTLIPVFSDNFYMKFFILTCDDVIFQQGIVNRPPDGPERI